MGTVGICEFQLLNALLHGEGVTGTIAVERGEGHRSFRKSVCNTGGRWGETGADRPQSSLVLPDSPGWFPTGFPS